MNRKEGPKITSRFRLEDETDGWALTGTENKEDEEIWQEG